jgi:hypothetical protein
MDTRRERRHLEDEQHRHEGIVYLTGQAFIDLLNGKHA